ncbi:MAG: hypothetical protein U0Q15_06975 [Kineosporiaceae bacterium]
MTTTTGDGRIAAWLLDRDGDLYGDERERIRWYEGTVVASSIQGLAVPWALAVGVWAHPDKGTAGVLLAVAIAFYLPLIWTAAWAQRHGVRVFNKTWTSKRLISTIAFVVPYVMFFIGVLRALSGLSGDTALGSWIGAGLGILGGLLAVAVQKRRESRRETSLEDVD